MNQTTAVDRLFELFGSEPVKLGRLLARIGDLPARKYKLWERLRKLGNVVAEKAFLEEALPPVAGGANTYNHVTVYLPNRSSGSGYIKRDFRKLTPNQLQKKLNQKGYFHVLPVDEQPPLLLQLADCCDRAEDVELRDGMQLAVVVDAKASTLLEQQVRFAH
ncbi:hypothetical protein GPECTOR_20g465 [Gonium pectorale]|uniref:Uncharacterized protein n=1 Tax=Gonium pectorale TaxID=33097 RepID=A0A150GIH8_GONPE|nr:hypothetical protein GPECTOR_20g465 [Gonium pectorale]|eukprot:KXZ49609.1 hypothetical protein GPECTOR_20g465 [Gonium pectorale]